jgi:GNAT superfamily N-acetyltransferase
VRVRTATNDDAESVLELAAMMAISFTVEPEPFRRSFDAVLTTASAHLLVAEDDGQVGGYLLGFEHPTFNANGPVGWVEEVAVDAGLRRRGVGTALMGAFEERARARGCRLIALATTRAGAFYAAIGYENRADYFRKVI